MDEAADQFVCHCIGSDGSIFEASKPQVGESMNANLSIYVVDVGVSGGAGNGAVTVDTSAEQGLSAPLYALTAT